MAYVILYFGGWWLMRIYAGIKQDLDFHRQCVDDAGLPASPCVRLKDPSFRDKQSRFSSGRGCYWRPEKQSLDDFLLNFLDSAFRLVRPKQDLSLEQVFDFCNVTLDHFKPVKSVESLIAEISSRMELIPGLTDLLSIDLSFEPKQNKQKRLI